MKDIQIVAKVDIIDGLKLSQILSLYVFKGLVRLVN